jgi:hypothetical protein
MKKRMFLPILAIILFSACNSNDAGSADHKNHDTAKTETNTIARTEEAKTVRPAFANLDAEVSGHVKDVFNHYIHVKTALVNSNASEAQNGAKAIAEVLSGFDRSLLPAEQKAAYDKRIGGINGAAKAIAGSTDLEKQREQFAQLSVHAYELAKAFGTGKTLYHDHCPMAFNDKGALWLSETKEIKNPYYGEKMLDCGTVEEVIE